MLCRIRIKYMEIHIIKKEITGSGPNQKTDTDILAKFEVMVISFLIKLRTATRMQEKLFQSDYIWLGSIFRLVTRMFQEN